MRVAASDVRKGFEDRKLIPIPDLLESNGVLAFDSSDNGLGTRFLM
jgi:hypothetical protein